ncbi:hypothetical protein ACVWXU_008066 [Streptomyces sp. TE33382]
MTRLPVLAGAALVLLVLLNISARSGTPAP